MSRPSSPKHDHPGKSADQLADHFLASHDGMSFDFDDYHLTIGGGAADRIQGTADRDYFWGRGGNDQLSGGAGDDVLYGNKGNDLITGGDGMDRVDGGMGNDRIFGGAIGDELMGGDGNDYLDEGAGHGGLEGGRGDDTLVGGQGPDAFVVDRRSGNDVIKDFTSGPGMFDHLALGDGLRWEDLTITQRTNGTLVSWEGGSALLEGVRRSDLAQDDFMFAEQPDLPPGARPPAGPAAERPSPSVPGPETGGSTIGRDQQSFDQAADAFLSRGRLEFDFDEFRVAVGTVRNDTIRGSDAGDHLFGRAGNDKLTGGLGNDVLQGDAGNDCLQSGAGSDLLDGGSGNDKLSSGTEADMLMGMEGNDRLDAGAGHDMVDGGMGNDSLIGGAGADAFIVDPMSGDDVVFDFEARGEAPGAFDHVALIDIDAEDVSVANTARGARISWDIDDDGRSEGSILLQGVSIAELRQSDFMFENGPQFVDGISDFGSYYIFS